MASKRIKSSSNIWIHSELMNEENERMYTDNSSSISDVRIFI